MRYLKLFGSFDISNLTLENISCVNSDYIQTLSEDFIEDIKEICFELNDAYPIKIRFDRTPKEHRSGARISNDDESIWESNPSITISIDQSETQSWKYSHWDEKRKKFYDPRWADNDATYRGRSKKIRYWNQICIDTANRIKNYLGDNFLLFTIDDNGYERDFELNDKTSAVDFRSKNKDGEWVYFPRLDVSNLKQGDIKEFRIVYKPDDYVK